MKENFAKSLELVLKSEGGNDDDPADHGGRTSRGITQREYDAWCREVGHPQCDVWKAPQEHIEQIYHDEYWMPWCDQIPIGTDYMFFDMCVNAGPHRAIVLGQQALHVNADGRVGPITREAFTKALLYPKVLCVKYFNAKEDFYRGLHQPRFLKGWLSRNKQVLASALAMIDGANNAIG
jgi:lysozyme family protein